MKKDSDGGKLKDSKQNSTKGDLPVGLTFPDFKPTQKMNDILVDATMRSQEYTNIFSKIVQPVISEVSSRLNDSIRQSFYSSVSNATSKMLFEGTARVLAFTNLISISGGSILSPLQDVRDASLRALNWSNYEPIPKGILSLWGDAADAMLKAQEALAPTSTNIARIIQDTLNDVAREIQELYSDRVVLTLLDEHRWLISSDLLTDDIRPKVLNTSDKEDIDNLLVDWAEQNDSTVLKEVEKRIANSASAKARAATTKEAFSCYRSGHYTAASMLLLADMEGIASAATKNTLSRKCYGKKLFEQVDLRAQRRAKDIDVSINYIEYKAPSAIVDMFTGEAKLGDNIPLSHASRHALMHGRITQPYDKIGGLKHIFLFDAFCQVLDKIRDD